MFDPNSTIKNVHEVRVTMRGVRISETGSPVQVSTRSDFIAPEVSPPSQLQLELHKGQRGWSDYEVKPEVVGYEPVSPLRTASGLRGSGLGVSAPSDAQRNAKRDLAAFTVGTVIPRRSVERKVRVLNVQGPAHRKVF